MLWLIGIGALILVYIWGWSSLLWCLLAIAVYVGYAVIADGVTHKKDAKAKGEAVHSLLKHIKTSFHESVAWHKAAKQAATSTTAMGTTGALSINALPASGAGPHFPREFSFSYVDHNGEQSQRSVRVMGIASNGEQQYLEGYCLDRQAVRTFRTDRIQGELIDMETGELVNVWNLLAQTEKRRSMTYKPSAQDSSTAAATATHREWKTAVLFTGFSQSRREELEDIALAAGWDVRSTVGPTLDYLVTGPRAGPAKVAKATDLGVAVIDDFEFESLAV